MDIVNLDDVAPFITKDGSEIRELLAPRNSHIQWQSLAEARIPVGQATTAHHHRRTEEIYYVVEGSGLMEIDDQARAVRPGDAIAIPPGTTHRLTNTGDIVLRILCCCAPAYEHDDTFLDEEPTESAQRFADRSESDLSGGAFVRPDDYRTDVGA
ncbi:MAG: cupin domain-containing protein [Pirellulaceae bacterium]|nr:cupin domain-containing protein [Planctomycetales bacterium]